MKHLSVSFRGFVAAALCIACLAAPAFAQNGGAGEKGAGEKSAGEKSSRVAVIDMRRISMEYARAKDVFSEIDEESMQINQEFKVMYEKYTQQVKVYAELKPGTPDHAKKEAELTKAKTNLEVFKQTKSREIQRKKLQANRLLFDDIQDAVTKVAEHYGYGTVLQHSRFTSEKPDPREVQAALSQSVVWSRKRDDITDAVLEVMNRRYEKSTGGAVQPASGSRPATKKASVKQAAE